MVNLSSCLHTTRIIGLILIQALPAKETQAPAASTSKVVAKPSPDPESEFEFSDVATLMCLLCARQFKTLDVLKRHNKESDLHKVRMHRQARFMQAKVNTCRRKIIRIPIYEMLPGKRLLLDRLQPLQTSPNIVIELLKEGRYSTNQTFPYLKRISLFLRSGR